VSGALAFAAGTHSDQRFTSVFRTASRCMCAGMGLASLPRFQLCAYLVSPAMAHCLSGLEASAYLFRPLLRDGR
jgi:hypothetical protein